MNRRIDLTRAGLSRACPSSLSRLGAMTPQVRLGHTAVYDPLRNRIIVFGGWNQGGPRNDVWTLSLSGTPEWNKISPFAPFPPGRSRHGAIYDPIRDRLVIFGGRDAANAPLGDVWSLALDEEIPCWTQMTPGGAPPSARYNHSAEYDHVRDRIVVFGGYDGSAPMMNDLWALSLDGAPEWSPLSFPGGPPDPRSGHGAIYDPVRDRMIFVWGHDLTRLWNDTWELPLGDMPQWSVIPPGAIPFAGITRALYDPVRDRVVVVVSPSDLSPVDVWALSLTPQFMWSRITPTGTPPSGRSGHSVIYDPPRDRLLLFGGFRQTVSLNDVWALALSGTPAWNEIVPDGAPPAARSDHVAIYDPVRDRMVIHGGASEGPVSRRDAWILSLAGTPAWSELSPAGTKPLGRFGHSAIYDPAGDRMIVFGGRNGPTTFADVWDLSLDGATAWAQLQPTGALPSGTAGHSAIHDPLRERMVVFDGFQQPPDPGVTRTLTLSGGGVVERTRAVRAIAARNAQRARRGLRSDPRSDDRGRRRGRRLRHRRRLGPDVDPSDGGARPGRAAPGARRARAAVAEPVRALDDRLVLPRRSRARASPRLRFGGAPRAGSRGRARRRGAARGRVGWDRRSRATRVARRLLRPPGDSGVDARAEGRAPQVTGSGRASGLR